MWGFTFYSPRTQVDRKLAAVCFDWTATSGGAPNFLDVHSFFGVAHGFKALSE
uniref:hypothetical protein n=1 Tax=Helicobacter pylori TaxID=210 RepID=UPI0037C1A364